MRTLRIVLTALTACCLAAPALAASIFNFEYNAGVYSGIGTFTADVNGDGSLTVLDVDGSVTDFNRSGHSLFILGLNSSYGSPLPDQTILSPGNSSTLSLGGLSLAIYDVEMGDVFAHNIYSDSSGTYVVSSIDDLFHLTGGWAANVDVSPVPATSDVPEPATWAMMLIGFGMVGATIRRRQNIAFA